MEQPLITSDFTTAKYRPVTLPGDTEHFFVGEYDDVGFKGLHSIHNDPLSAIKEADKLNAKL